MNIQELKSERERLIRELNSTVDRAKAQGRDLTAAEKPETNSKVARVKAIDKQLEPLEKSAKEKADLESFLAKAENGRTRFAKAEKGSKTTSRPRAQSQMAKAIADLVANPIPVAGSLTDPQERRFTDSSGYDHRPIDPLSRSHTLEMPTAMRDDGGYMVMLPDPAARIVPHVQQSFLTDGEYRFYRMTNRSDLAAGFVKPGERKPTGEFGYEVVKDHTRTVAILSEPMSRQELRDVSGLVLDLGGELARRVVRRLDAAMLTGQENDQDDTFNGILTTDEVPRVGYAQNPLVTIRTAMTQLESAGMPSSSIVVHPTTWQEIELTTDANQRPLMPGVYASAMQPTLFGAPVVVSDLMPEDQVIVGDLQACLLSIRDEMGLSWSDGGDLFETNTVRFRAEVRVGFNIVQPLALRIASLTDGAAGE